MQIEDLATIIAQAAKVSFTETRDKFGKDQIVGYSILSHDTADSCGPVAATIKAQEAYDYGPDDDFLFDPVEWDLFDNGPSFNQVNEEIAKLYDAGDYEEDPDWHEKFREFVFEANVKALESLVSDGFFGTNDERSNVFVVFSLSDSETSETHVPHWVSRLNSDTINQNYSTWRNSKINA